jgi:hypothetical protein
MAKSSKPKEIVVVGSKINETSNVPDGLDLNVGDDLLATLSWDVDLAPSSGSPPPGFMTSFFDDFEPASKVQYPFGTFLENPLGVTIAINDNLPQGGDEVLVLFVHGDTRGNLYEFGIRLSDPSGTAFDGLPRTTPLDLQLHQFATASVSLREVGAADPFATGDILSLESRVVPEPATVVMLVSMLGTLAVHRFFRRAKQRRDVETVPR